MCHFLSTIIGAFLAAMSGYWLFWLKQRADARANFLAVTAGLRAQLNTMQHTDEPFFSDSKLLVGRSVYQVRRYLCPVKRKRMEDVWIAYTAEDKKEFGTKSEMLEGILRTNRTPKQRLYDYLAKLDGCI